jgi:hypothetical protein
MVTVAQGGGTGENVPMLLRLPRLQDEFGGYSMLGLGDIALPGLFISYLLRFDYSHVESMTRGFWQTYFALGSVGYALGLLLTYLALVLSSSGQPALLYLVPCTLGVVLPTAWVRGDLREMWTGAGEGGERSAAAPLRTAARRTNGQYAAVGVNQQETADEPTIEVAKLSSHQLDHDLEEKEMLENL